MELKYHFPIGNILHIKTRDGNQSKQKRICSVALKRSKKKRSKQKNPAKRWIFCYLESMYIDSTKFPISVIKRIIPAIVVNVAIEAKGLKNITSPNAK